MGHTADCEARAGPRVAITNDRSLEDLYPFAISLHDFRAHAHRVTRPEGRHIGVGLQVDDSVRSMAYGPSRAGISARSFAGLSPPLARCARAMPIPRAWRLAFASRSGRRRSSEDGLETAPARHLLMVTGKQGQQEHPCHGRLAVGCTAGIPADPWSAIPQRVIFLIRGRRHLAGRRHRNQHRPGRHFAEK